MTKKKIFSAILSLFFVSFAFSCTFFVNQNAQDFLHGFEMTLKNTSSTFYKMKSLPTDSASLMSFQSNDGQILRFQSFPAPDESEAKKIFQYRARIIQALFETKTVAYVGKVTKEESCLAQNSAKSETEKTNEGFFQKFDLMATKNFVYGVCTDSENYYKSQYLLLYCAKSKTVMEAKLFYEKSNSTFIEPIIECEKQ